MTHTYATAATQYIQAGATRYAYRRMGRDSGVPLIFLQNFRQGMDSTDPSLLDGFAEDRPVIIFDNAGVAGSVVLSRTKHHLAAVVAVPWMLRSEPLPSGVSSEDRHRLYADVAAPKTPSQRLGWLMALTWDMVCYCADKHPTTRILLERILAHEEEHANDMHDLLVGHEGHPMLKK